MRYRDTPSANASGIGRNGSANPGSEPLQSPTRSFPPNIPAMNPPSKHFAAPLPLPACAAAAVPASAAGRCIRPENEAAAGKRPRSRFLPPNTYGGGCLLPSLRHIRLCRWDRPHRDPLHIPDGAGWPRAWWWVPAWAPVSGRDRSGSRRRSFSELLDLRLAFLSLSPERRATQSSKHAHSTVTAQASCTRSVRTRSAGAVTASGTSRSTGPAR